MHPCVIKIRSKQSLIHIGSLDSFDITDGGIAAARHMLSYLESGDKDFLRKAVSVYEDIIPNENFGGEYTALQWICRLLLAPDDAREGFLNHPTVRSWYDLLSRNGYEKLKEYLTYKYHFKELADKQSVESRNLRFLEDFILFQNPDRIRWENTEDYLRRLAVKKGSVIADLGCGPGYYSFKFADITGEGGKVYAIETNPLHLDYLRGFVREQEIENVEIIEGGLDGIGLAPGTKADMVFTCSLYHVLYAALTEEERNKFIRSIVNCLNENGRFVILDNDMVAGGDLPYHGPYISKDLVISQLYHYGFKLSENLQITPQRYALVFELSSGNAAMPDKSGLEEDEVLVETGSSLVVFRIAEAAATAGYTPEGRKAAELFLTALENRDALSAETALSAYETLIPKERIGDEYTAFQWCCRYIASDPDKRAGMASDPMTVMFLRHMGGDDFHILKQYVNSKYELAAGREAYMPLENLTQLSEFITFNNPDRDRWEKTERMLEYINIKKGEYVADVGCGSGFFTYRFALAAGGSGKVYATEINKEALVYVEELRDRYGLPVETVLNGMDDLMLPENSVDTVFMCSMYHAVYIASIEYVKDRFIESVRKALRKDGRLIIVDNDIARQGIPPYFGSAISKELAIHQLKHYGFRLTSGMQFIPQRYALQFTKI